jgi:dihydrofolate reductase
MSSAVLDMSISLDGYIAGPNERPDNGLGDGGERLHAWFALDDEGDGAARFRLPPGVNGQVFGEALATGAVVAGPGTFEAAGGWGGDHHDGVPIFIYSRREPGIDISRWPLVTYVDDVVTAITRAKQAAGDRNVLVHGAAVMQLALKAGVIDEIELHVVPVLLGGGRRLFDHLGPDHIELERVRVLHGEQGVTHLRYRVRRSGTDASPIAY